MLPPHLIAEFWATVKQELLERHDLCDASADEAIHGYRLALARHQADEMVYHRNPEAVAETIAAGWKRGFPDPRREAKA